MPRSHPEDDIGVFQIDEKIQQERVFCKDLALHLGVGLVQVTVYAKSRGWLHRPPRYDGRPKPSYVTPYAAARIVVYIRAKQEMKWEADRKKRERKAARLRQSE